MFHASPRETVARSSRFPDRQRVVAHKAFEMFQLSHRFQSGITKLIEVQINFSHLRQPFQSRHSRVCDPRVDETQSVEPRNALEVGDGGEKLVIVPAAS